MATKMKIGIGSTINRVDGHAKVTGGARYAAEYPILGMLYGFVVSGGIAKGRIASIDEAAARAVPGVVEVLTHRNRPHVAYFDHAYHDEVGPPGSPFRALYDDKIIYNGQPIAVVLAETFEAARFAASLVEVAYEADDFNTDFQKSLAEEFSPRKKRNSYHPPKSRGDADKAYATAPLRIASTYHLATEHHNPMEMFATTVDWQGDGKITVYDKTQGSQNVQKYLSKIFGFTTDDVRVMNPYMGGGFGSGLRPQYQVYLAVMAAKLMERSIRLVMTRQQMFTHTHRPEAHVEVKLGTDEGGRLVSVINNATTGTSRYENNMEDTVVWGLMNYACPNASGDYKIAPRDIATSGDMRAPGAATGMNLFEIAMDEMAWEARIDPLNFRLINYSDIDAMNGTPYTSKALREAYAQGAAKFGWDARSLEPRSMRDGSELIGWGVATGMWDAQFSKTSAKARLNANGQLEVSSAASDIGTGTYTVMTLVAADTLGLQPDRITATLGDSSLPTAPVEGGSWMAASVGYAVQLACRGVGEKLLKAAAKIEGKPLGRAGFDDVLFENGEMILKADPTRRTSIADAIAAGGHQPIEVEETATAGFGGQINQLTHSKNSHSANFCEVRIDEELGVIRVTRFVCAVAAGRIISPKQARSQILGGVVMGLGMALHEESMMDDRIGRWMNHNYAEYHIPVNADVEDIDVIFVDEPDPDVTPLGVKGLGEIGIVGSAGAIANAIWHATGKRVRSLPITIDKLL